MRNSDGYLFIGDQVFQLQFGGLVEDLGAARVAEFLAGASSSLRIRERSFGSLPECLSYSAIRSRTSASTLRISSVESWVRR